MVGVEGSHAVALIPARGGSKEIPSKNLKLFCGKPLIAWTIEQLLLSGIKDVYVSTDSEEIGEVSRGFGASVIWRPAELAKDSATSESALLHAVAEVGLDHDQLIVFAQATSPLRPLNIISEAIDYFADSACDSVYSAVRLDDLTVWIDSDGIITPHLGADSGNRPSRQMRKATYVETGSFYLTLASSLIESRSRVSGLIKPFIVPNWTLHELDSPHDWDWMEKLMNNLVIERGCAK